MSKVSEAVDNARYDMDWFKRRKNVVDAIMPFAYGDECEKRIYAQMKVDEDKIVRSMFFLHEGFLYVWTDLLVNGLIESSQLEHVYTLEGHNKVYAANMLYCHSTKDKPVGPYMLKKLLNGELEILAE